MCADHGSQPGAGRLPGFEEIYVRAGQDFSAIPWAALAPNPALVSWLDQQPSAAGDPALIIGCGLGDDAEQAARRGYRVTAFAALPRRACWRPSSRTRPRCRRTAGSSPPYTPGPGWPDARGAITCGAEGPAFPWLNPSVIQAVVVW